MSAVKIGLLAPFHFGSPGPLHLDHNEGNILIAKVTRKLRALPGEKELFIPWDYPCPDDKQPNSTAVPASQYIVPLSSGV